MGYLQARQYLESFINYEIHLHKISASEFKLDRIVHLLELLGNPQAAYKIIHVAGSKGKGSTSVITATMLDQAGFRVGLYTSPHLYDFRERIRVLKKPYCSSKKDELFGDTIKADELVKLVNQLKPFVEQIHRKKKFGKLTYFEILTALALLYFKHRKVDFAVLETGLGGRLDATNAVSSDIAVMTPISLEHTNILGKSITKIATEKAGIIKKPKQNVVLAPQVKVVSRVFEKRCRKFLIQPRVVKSRGDLKINLLGAHQKINTSTALCVIDCLREKGCDIPVSAVQRAVKNIYWPGRLEIIGRKPMVIIDGAHNLDSIEKLIQSVKEIIGRRRVIVIFSAAKDKDVKGMLNQLNKISDHIILAQMNHPRSFVFTNKLSGMIAPDVGSAVKSALAQANKEDVVLVTGSLFLVSEARKLWFN